MATITEFSTDGFYVNDGFEMKTNILPWQDKGLSYTASGYGAKIPTPFMLIIGKVSYRIYCRIFSNVGTTYIISKGEKYIVRDFQN